MTQPKYYIGQTLQIKDSTLSVVVRKIIAKTEMLWVSYGVDRNGKEIVGLIHPGKHCNH